jgi:hypothetical protein
MGVRRTDRSGDILRSPLGLAHAARRSCLELHASWRGALEWHELLPSFEAERARYPASHEAHEARPHRALPRDRTLPRRVPAGFEAAHAALGRMRQSQGQAARVPARRPRRRHGSDLPPLLRPEEVAHRAVQPARLRQEHAARGAAREHDLGSRQRHREAARAPRHRQVGRLRRQLGQHAQPRLRADAHVACARPRPARHFPAAPQRTPVVLPGGREPPVPRRLGPLPRADPQERTRRPDEGLLQAPHEPEQGRARARGEGLVDLGGHDEQAVRRPQADRALRRRPVRRRFRAHRGALLRQQRLPQER